MKLTERIADAGVVGCGGAGFPTAAKLDKKYDYLLINGAECEPLLRTDRYLMLHRADDIVSAVEMVRNELGITEAVIALKHDYSDEMAALSEAVKRSGANIKLHGLESYYPAGDEQMIVYEVTGRIVPPGGIPGSVGVVVDNVGTMVAVSDAMKGIPFTHKYLTVAGRVHSPSVLRVPVGTSFLQCIEAAGGTLDSSYVIISGGPAMGRIIPMDRIADEVVTKTTSGILVLPADGYHAAHFQMDVRQMLRRARSACIQCTYCTQLCPRHLLGHPIRPNVIMRKMAMARDIRDMLTDPEIRNAQFCSQCGVCEMFACPMGLQPRTINSLIKSELAKNRIRIEYHGTCTASPDREMRKVPSEKFAARLGLLKYYHYKPAGFLEPDVRQVRIPLKMNVGVPSVPAVRKGDHVRTGTLLADRPANSLGARIHSGIDGIVTDVNEQFIAVTREN